MLALLIGLAASTAAASAPAAKPVEVMVLGTYHFSNPGRDLNNIEADDVLSARRQAELVALTDALAKFRPTKIMVEREVADPSLVDPNYAAFQEAELRTNRNERVQIAYRLAKRLRLKQVYAIDEQSGPGEPDYFPYGKLDAYAKANGRAAELDAISAAGPVEVARFEALQKRTSLAGLLVDANGKDYFGGIGFYYRLLGIGDTQTQPGAELNAGWYLRNAKIFAKLMTVARPGDRVLVVYGAGHNYWLRHFASVTPGYANVDPVPLLRAAKTR